MVGEEVDRVVPDHRGRVSGEKCLNDRIDCHNEGGLVQDSGAKAQDCGLGEPRQA